MIFEKLFLYLSMAEKESLSQISFSVQQRAKPSGLWGRTGPGLIRRVHGNTHGQGKFTINGQPVARYVRRSLRKNRLRLSEHIFKSILENISLGRGG